LNEKESEYTLDCDDSLTQVGSIQTILTELDKLISYFIEEKANRKLRVATKIGSTFFLFLMSNRAAEIVQNDYLSSA
jgi:hypothetical protein